MEKNDNPNPLEEKEKIPRIFVEFKTSSGKKSGGLLKAYVPEWGKAIVNAPDENDIGKAMGDTIRIKAVEVPIENLELTDEQQAKLDAWLSKRKIKWDYEKNPFHSVFNYHWFCSIDNINPRSLYVGIF